MYSAGQRNESRCSTCERGQRQGEADVTPGNHVLHGQGSIHRVDRLGVAQVDGRLVSSIGPGLLCLIGVKESDTQADQDFL